LRCGDHSMHEVTTDSDMRRDQANVVRPDALGDVRPDVVGNVRPGRADVVRPHRADRVWLWPPTDGWEATERLPVAAVRNTVGTVVRAGPPGRVHGPTTCCLLLVATLNARALEQLAVLLLRHPLTPLLDNRAHDYPRSLLGQPPQQRGQSLGAGLHWGPHDLRGASLPRQSSELVIEVIQRETGDDHEGRHRHPPESPSGGFHPHVGLAKVLVNRLLRDSE